jgi:hypothetical protein
MKHYCCAAIDPGTNEAVSLYVSEKPLHRDFTIQEVDLSGVARVFELEFFTVDTRSAEPVKAWEARGHLARSAGIVGWKAAAPGKLKGMEIKKEVRDAPIG